MQDFFENKVVFISGGTGFLGSRLIKYILAEHSPRKVISFSRRWNDSEKLVREIGDSRLRVINGDVRDLYVLSSAMKGVDYVVHTASFKSVPSAEYNPVEATEVNVGGSINIIRSAIDNGVERVIGVSTDKAVNAINTYGRSKALMESLFANANNLGKTRFSLVAYGNVAGSSGSVIPLFHSIINSSGHNVKLSVTCQNMTRFWFRESDAVKYVVRCLIEMEGGERYVPILKSSTISDLVVAFRKLYQDRNIQCDIIGTRPGEKMHEAMISPDEADRVYEKHWTYIVAPFQHDWDAEWGRSLDGCIIPYLPNGYTSDNAKRYTIDELVELIK